MRGKRIEEKEDMGKLTHDPHMSAMLRHPQRNASIRILPLNIVGVCRSNGSHLPPHRTLQRYTRDTRSTCPPFSSEHTPLSRTCDPCSIAYPSLLFPWCTPLPSTGGHRSDCFLDSSSRHMLRPRKSASRRRPTSYRSLLRGRSVRIGRLCRLGAACSSSAPSLRPRKHKSGVYKCDQCRIVLLLISCCYTCLFDSDASRRIADPCPMLGLSKQCTHWQDSYLWS